MSDDGFSWAPFGPSTADDPEPLPPLREDKPPVSVPPPPVLPLPEYDLERLPFEEPPAPPPSTSVAARSVPPPFERVTDIAPATKQRPRVRGGGDAAASLVWGILGVTILPIFITSVAAIRLGRRAKAASGGLGQTRSESLATWGVALGWIGVGFWVLLVGLAVLGAAISPD